MKLLTTTVLALSLGLSPLAAGIAIAQGNDQMQMMKSSPNAENAPYDLQFIDTMIEHHKGAMQMAQMALDKAQNPKIKEMAQNMVDDQQEEIAKMKKMRGKSYKNQPEAVNMEFPGMMDSMKGMDMVKLEQSSGPDFDLLFINMMIPHHQGAISMSEDTLKNASQQNIKKMAQDIIKKQTKEVSELEKIRDELKTAPSK